MVITDGKMTAAGLITAKSWRCDYRSGVPGESPRLTAQESDSQRSIRSSSSSVSTGLVM